MLSGSFYNQTYDRSIVVPDPHVAVGAEEGALHHILDAGAGVVQPCPDVVDEKPQAPRAAWRIGEQLDPVLRGDARRDCSYIDNCHPEIIGLVDVCAALWPVTTA